MLKLDFNASIMDVKTAAENYLAMIKYEYCDDSGREDYNYMQGVYDAICLIEQHLNEEL